MAGHKRSWLDVSPGLCLTWGAALTVGIVFGYQCGSPFRTATLAKETEAMPTTGLTAGVMPILLLLASNVFMTFAWYGHLKFKEQPLVVVILASWGIALIEYCLAVPANRYGHAVYSAAELKTIQEIVTLVVFAIFSWAVLKEPLGWNHAVGFALIATGAGVVFMGRA